MVSTNIVYTFLNAKHPCKRTHHDTIEIYLQDDISLDINNNIQIVLPLSFKIYGGCCVINTIDDRLVPVKETYMNHSLETGQIVTIYNRSYSRFDATAGTLFMICRHIK